MLNVSNAFNYFTKETSFFLCFNFPTHLTDSKNVLNVLTKKLKVIEHS